MDGKLLVKYSKDVCTKLYVYSLDGEMETEVVLPTIGTAYGFNGKMEDKEVFYTFTSFISHLSYLFLSFIPYVDAYLNSRKQSKMD